MLRCRHVLVLMLAAGVMMAPSRTTLGQTRPQAPRLAAFDVMEQSIEALQKAMEAGQVTSRQIVELYLARIDAYDQRGPALNAVISVNPQARAAADALDAERTTRGARGPLHGIPVLVKDNYETIEMPTSAGTMALAGYRTGRDAFMVRKLKEAGAVILGKTNMHELAAGITTVGSLFGQTLNPYDLDRNPGGSSGGTGAAIAANFAAVGMGSDTCGSIRNPASHNNLVGLRGTQGLSSRTGIVPLSTTQDIGGPIARGIADLAIVLDATVGADPADPGTTISDGHIPRSYRAGLRADALKGARLGVLRSQFGTAAEDGEVTGVVQKALDGLKQAGADLVDVVVPGLDDLLRDSSMITSDFKFDLADYLAHAPNPPVKSLGEVLDRGLYHIALEGTFRTRNAVESRESDASRRARIKRVALRHALESVLLEHRLVALVHPTLRRKPARIGEGQVGSACTVSAHSGLPALGIPAGFSADDLPIGIDLLGAAWSEPELLSLGYSIEQTLKLRRAPFSTPALVDGRAPAPRTASVSAGTTTINLSLDTARSELAYTIGAPNPVESLRAIWIHAGTVDKPAAARHQLYANGHALTGTVTLSAQDRRDLAEGRLVLRVYGLSPGAPTDRALRFP